MAYIAVAPSMGYSFGDRNEKMGADRARETPAFICAKHKLMCEAQVPIFSTGIPPLVSPKLQQAGTYYIFSIYMLSYE